MNIQTSAFLIFSFYCSVVEAKKKKSKLPPPSSQNQQLFEYAFLAVGVIVLIAALVYLLQKRQQLMRAEKLKSIKRALEVKELSRKDRPCTMTQMQKDEAVVWFSKQNWVLEESQPKQKATKVPLQIVSFKRKEQTVDGQKFLKDYYDAFYIEMKGGSSKIFGVIMFQKYYMTIIFEKSVSNAKNQNGTYDYKFFEGILKKGQFQGRWQTSNDKKVQQEKEALKQIEKNSSQDPLSQRSFSKGDRQSQDSMLLSKTKQLKGSFKLYHQ